MRAPRAVLTLGLALGLMAAGLWAVPAHADRPAARADDGAHVTKVRHIDARLVELTISSPALGRAGHARVLLPPDYRRDPGRRWPVLYLLHGCCDTVPGWTTWTDDTDVEKFTAHTDVMIVMPEAGPAGFYSDWWNHGRYGAPAWETFHLTELRTILERGWRAGTRRAVAGLSMGGFGALSYAARHPRMFRAAASFSGYVDTGPYGPGLEAVMATQGVDPSGLWGDPVLQHRIWRAHNPYDLMKRLRGLPLYIASGDGRPGPYDPPGRGDAGEAIIGPLNVRFVAKARRLHLRMTADLYGPGTHSWPYWQRDLHRAWPLLTAALGVTGAAARAVRP